MAICKDLKNFGAATCRNPMQIAKRLIIVPELGASGSENEIATVAGVTKTALQLLFNEVDKLDRYYPTPLLENVENVRGETTFHEFNSGAKLRVKEGTKHFVGYIPAEHPLMLEGLKSFEGQNFGILVIDKDGNLIYLTDATTKLKVKPFPIDGNSLSVTYVEPTDKEVPMIKLEFDYSVSSKDELMRYIAAEDLDFNALSTVDVYSLLTVTGTSTGGADKLTLVLATEYGDAITGLDEDDMDCTDSAGDTVTISSVEESTSTPGTYTVNLTITGAKTVTTTITKSRYDFSAITALTAEATHS